MKKKIIRALAVVVILEAGLLGLSLAYNHNQAVKIRNQERTIKEADTLMFNLIDGYPVHYGD